MKRTRYAILIFINIELFPHLSMILKKQKPKKKIFFFITIISVQFETKLPTCRKLL